MSYQFDIDDCLDYIEGLCRDHVEINHSVTNRCFARGEEHIEAVRKNAGKIVVVVVSIDGRRHGIKDDQQLRREVVLRVAAYADAGVGVTDAKKRARKKAEEIMFDIWNKMEHQQELDLDGEEACSIMRFLEPEAMSFEEIEAPWLINHYGWDLTIPFKVYMPQYNAEKWRR